MVPTDVSDSGDVDRLADEAFRRFGRIDAWVNNAGVYLMGTLEQTPMAAHRQLMDTNYFGVVHGTRAAVRYMKRQPGGGSIINVSSQLGSVSGAYLSAYTASKHAVRGFTSAVRQELIDTPIRLVTVMPASVDTPLFEHSANYTGREMKPAAPVFPPEKVARTIAHAIEHPRAETYVGGVSSRMFGTFRHVAPGAFDRVMRSQLESGHFTGQRQGRTSGNVFGPMERGTSVHGGHHGRTRQWARRLALFGALGAGAAVLARRASTSGRRSFTSPRRTTPLLPPPEQQELPLH